MHGNRSDLELPRSASGLSLIDSNANSTPPGHRGHPLMEPTELRVQPQNRRYPSMPQAVPRPSPRPPLRAAAPMSLWRHWTRQRRGGETWDQQNMGCGSHNVAVWRSCEPGREKPETFKKPSTVTTISHTSRHSAPAASAVLT